MKKFLSYLLTFVTLFVISATVTIKVKSDLLTTSEQTNITASASSETGLLAGIMSSLENNPKQNVAGNMSLVVDGQPLSVDVDLDLNLAELTNPEIKGNVVVEYNGNHIDALITMIDKTIYITCGNISVSANIEDLSDIVDMFSSLLSSGSDNVESNKPSESEQTIIDEQQSSAFSLDLSSLDLDAIMDAFNSPKVTTLGQDQLYEITIDGLAKVNILCDQNFNIKNVQIEELYLLSSSNIDCSINMVADSNIEISQPTNSEYLDVASLAESIQKLVSADSLSASAWTAIYKNGSLFEYVESSATLNISAGQYKVSNKLSGALSASLNLAYDSDIVYLNLDQLYLKADSAAIGRLVNMLTASSEGGTAAVEANETISSVLEWLKDNYSSILDSAIISADQIKIVVDMTGILGQSGPIKLILNLADGQISSVRLSGISVGDYTIATTIYVSANSQSTIYIDKSVYFDANNLLDLVDFATNMDGVQLSARVALTTEQKTIVANLTMAADFVNNSYSVQIEYDGHLIKLTYTADTLYVAIDGAIMLKGDAALAKELLGLVDLSNSSLSVEEVIDNLGLQDMYSRVVIAAELAKQMSINDILSILNLQLNNNGLQISADLTDLFGETFIIDAIANYNKKLSLTINNLQLGNIKLTANVVAENCTSTISVSSAEKYLNIKDVLDAANKYSEAQTILAAASLTFGADETLVGFDGNIYISLSSGQIEVVGTLRGKIDGQIRLVIANEVVYVEYGELKISASIDTLAAVCSQFGIDILPIIEKVENIADQISGIDVYEKISSLLGSLNISDLANIDYANLNITSMLQASLGSMQINSLSAILEKLSGISLNANGLTASVDLTGEGYGKLNVGATFGEDILLNVSGLQIADYNLSASLTIAATEHEYLFDAQDYISLDGAEQLVEPIENLISSKSYFGKATIAVGDVSVIVDYNLGLQNGNIVASVAVSAFGLTINATILGNKVYVEFMDTKISTTFDGLLSCVANIMAKLDVDGAEKIEELSSKIEDFDLSNMLSVSGDDLWNTSNGVLNTIYTKQIINSVSIAENKAELNIAGDINLAIEYANGAINAINIYYGEISASVEINGSENEYTTSVDEAAYTNLADYDELIDTIIDLTKNISYGGKFELTYKDISLEGTYQVKYEDGKISAKLETTFYGLEISVIYINDTIYINAGGLAVKIATSEITDLVAWVNKEFNTNINLDSNSELDIEELVGKISKVMVAPNAISAEFAGAKLEVTIDNGITAKVDYKDISAQLTIASASVEIDVDDAKYQHYTELLGIIEDVVQLYNDKQFAVSATAQVYDGNNLRFNATCTLQVDLNDFAIYANAALTGEKDINLTLAYYNSYWYLDYNGLKLKIYKDDLAEVLAIVLEAMGIDPSAIPFLQSVVDDLSVDVNNITTAFPDLDLNNPLSLLTYIKNISMSQNEIVLLVDGKKVTTNPNADTMTVKLSTDGTRLTNIDIDNMFTGVTENEYFNLQVYLDKFAGVSKPADGNYVDLSGANELIKALINTAELNYYEIDGSLKIKGDLAGITISWDVPVNIKVKLDEERKPEIMITIGEIPTMVGVNNDVPYEFGDTESGSDRMLYVYYKDGYVYFYRSEYVDIMFGASKRLYEKKLKITVDELLANPLDYLQYGVGFTDTIMDAIRESLAKSEGYTPDYSKVIKSFTAVDSTNFSITLDMYEITNDSNMGDMTIGLGVINNSQTGNKNYLGTATFSLNMPFTSSISLLLSSNNLQLINIGKELDFSSLYTFVNGYTYGVDEQWEASKGSWSKAADKTYTYTFESNGGTEVADVVGAIGTTFTYPTMTKATLDDGEKQVVYTFAGWYTSSSLADKYKLTECVITRGDKTLYAKWDETVTYYHTITFVDALHNAPSSIKALTGAKVTIPRYADAESYDYVTDGMTITYKFVGWSASSTEYEAISITTMPDEDTTLYATWEEVSRRVSVGLKIYDNGVLIEQQGLSSGDTITLSSAVNFTSTTLWYLDSSYTYSYTWTGTMPDYSLELYIRNIYTITVNSKYSNNGTYQTVISDYQGANIASRMPSYSSYSNSTAEYEYLGLDKTYSVMPNYNDTVTAQWKVWVTLTFSKDTSVVSAYKSYISFPVSSLRVEQGTVVDLSQYTPTWEYTTGSGIFKVNWYYKFEGWSLSKGGSTITSITPTSNTTIYANWNGTVKSK